jgi:hypothetical protein
VRLSEAVDSWPFAGVRLFETRLPSQIRTPHITIPKIVFTPGAPSSTNVSTAAIANNAAAMQLRKSFTPEKNLRKGLVRLGKLYLARQLAPLVISNMRIVATQPAESGIGEDFYRNILCPAWDRVSDAFKALMSSGQLRRADPWLATMHFKGLVLQDLLERRLLNAAKRANPKEVETAAKHAVDAFLMIYGNEAPAPSKARR